MILIVKSTLALNTSMAALLAPALTVLALLSGCGQTGPLTMPKPPAKTVPLPVPPHLPSASSPAAQ